MIIKKRKLEIMLIKIQNEMTLLLLIVILFFYSLLLKIFSIPLIWILNQLKHIDIHNLQNYYINIIHHMRNKMIINENLNEEFILCYLFM